MEKIKSFYRKHFGGGVVFCFICGFLLELIIETMARKGLGGFRFLAEEPLLFLYNAFVITATLSVALLFRHRTFVFVFVIAAWFTVGLANGVILMQRVTPFTVKDLDSLADAATILTNYFNRSELILIATGICAGVIAVVLLWFRLPRRRRRRGTAKTAVVVVLIVGAAFASTFGLIKAGKLATFFGNLGYAYSDYGFPYCFINTWLNTGIGRPSGYSEKNVKALLPAELEDEEGDVKIVSGDVDENYPNIIFLQLESFTDPELINNISLSGDAIPYYRQLMNEYSSGYLMVPACGAGTANTEFEVMTGLSVRFFGPGEYPFKGILRKVPCESAAYDLKELGFGTHAIHNHRALFYNRNEALADLGYDSFTSVEYMSDVIKNPKNWAKDSILTRHIMDALRSTESRDYIYTVSVQGHGKYPERSLIADPEITVTEAPTTALKNKFEYYVNQIHEMDRFVHDLTVTLSNYEEPVVLVMYGDHIPALELTEQSYERDLFETPYVIWTNYDSRKVDADCSAYELTARVFDMLGIHAGTVFQYEQTADRTAPGYLDGLKMLGYDMIYGKHYIYGGSSPFRRSDMKMGVKPITIDKVVYVGGTYYIKGRNFTEYSKVTLRGETLSTIYLSPTLLGLKEPVDPNDAPEMKVSQIDKSNKEIISSTE